MALNLKEIQAKLLAQQANRDRAKSGSGFGGDNAVYPFWNNPDNSVAAIRFLPDGDETNDFFWIERLIIRLPFVGVKGGDENKKVDVQVPSTDMWKAGTCPITAEIRPWWKDPSLEDMARTYYRKKSYLLQGFVTDNPNKEDQAEKPIRRFIMNPSVFDRIKIILMAQDIEHSPTDYDNGMDFYLSKKTKGKWANYDDSGWTKPGSSSPKARALNSSEREALETQGLWNLNSFLPKKPDDEHLAAIMELFTASVNGELYDADRWGSFYSPSGMKTSGDGSSSTKTTVPVSTPAASSPVTAASILNRATKTVEKTEEKTAPWVASDDDVPEVNNAVKKKIQSPDDIIAAIRARQQK